MAEFIGEGLEELAERRNGDAEEHQCSDRAGALTAQPRQRSHREGKAALQGDRHMSLARSEPRR